MLYTKVTFSFSFEEDYLQDVFYQGLADLGFDSFMDDTAYIQTALLERQAIQDYAEQMGVGIVGIEDCPDENWNATWEAEHPVEELPDGVRIVPHCAFGAGHHETTGMMIESLLALDLGGKCVLDQGCGTGVLAIYAKKRGAAQVVAVDIDDKSVSNSLENAALNDVSLDVRLGAEVPEGQYDLILANIHRNILLDMMPAFGRTCKPGGGLWMSGFYEDDIQPLETTAKEHGFRLLAIVAKGEWRMMQMRKD